MKKATVVTILIISVFMSTRCPAALSGTIEGVVLDQKTGEAVAFANLILTGGGLKISHSLRTDLNGKFTCKEVKAGSYQLEVSAIGYTKYYEKNIVVLVGEITKLTIKLKPSIANLQQVEIEKPSPTKVKSTMSTKSEEINNITAPNSNQGFLSEYHNEKPLYSEFNTENYHHLAENEFHETSNTPLSTFSIDVDGASYANIRRYINNGSLPPVDAVRIEEMINYFKYDYPQPTGQDPFSINMEVTVCPWNQSHQLVSVGLQGKKIDFNQLPPSNLVFLVDVSGSMMPANKLPLLIKSLSLLTENLRKQDRIAIVVYAGSAGLVLPSTSGADKKIIIDALESLSAGGSTAGGAGIQLAYKEAKKNFIPNGNNRVIIATDGDFNVGVSSDGDLVRMIEEKKELGIFLTVLGFGTGNLKDSKMEQLANKGNGNYAYIDNIMEAKKVLVNEIGGTLFTIAKDVKLQIEFNPEYVKAYKLIGYENRMLKDKDFNDDKKDAGELGSGHTVTALYEIVPAGSNENVASVDPLKYQQPAQQVSSTNEMLTVKFRYKDPNGEVSKLITRSLKNKTVKFENASNNLKFASAVTAFGMILRKSELKGNATYESILTTARAAKGADPEGYRAEFIRLVETAQLLK